MCEVNTKKKKLITLQIELYLKYYNVSLVLLLFKCLSIIIVVITLLLLLL